MEPALFASTADVSPLLHIYLGPKYSPAELLKFVLLRAVSSNIYALCKKISLLTYPHESIAPIQPLTSKYPVPLVGQYS